MSKHTQTHPILSRIDWKKTEQIIIKEQKNREIYTPTISVFRWWARRPHALIGAILDAAIETFGKLPGISDPFSGGGTVAIESVRRGLSVYAQDLYPWPVFGLEVSLSGTSIKEFDATAKELLNYLESFRVAYRRSDGKEITHIIRVRVGSCPVCQNKIYLFPSPIISMISRSAKEEMALFGCRKCGHVHKAKHDSSSKCPSCHFKFPEQVKKYFSCPHCNHKDRILKFTVKDLAWKAVAVQELSTVNNRFRAVLRIIEDLDPVDAKPASSIFRRLKKNISKGIETERLLDAGFKKWGDIYTDRQAEVLLSALKWIRNSKASTECKNRLAIAVIGAAEMPAYICRWDSRYLKAYEGIANHRYAHTTLVVEANLLSAVGRGSIPRRLISARKALEWIDTELKQNLKPICLKSTEKCRPLNNAVLINTGTSLKQKLRTGSADIILTDPPYFDDVQYGELSRLLHLWLSFYKKVSVINEKNEAVPNRARGNDSEFYTRTISKCFKESQRTLSPGGKLIITFHNKKCIAWKALCKALFDSDFVISAMAAVIAENNADHTKRNGKGMLHDLVIECDKRNGSIDNNVAQIFGKRMGPAKSIICMGIAMDRAIRIGKPSDITELYINGLKRSKIKEGGIH